MSEINMIVVDAERVVTVPEDLRKIGVQGDHNIETLTFECPRYWDEGEKKHDLSSMTIYINYMRPDGETGRTLATIVKDKTTEEKMYFEWVVSRHTTEINGSLTFLVHIEKIEQKVEDGQPVYDADGQPVYVLSYAWNSELNKDLFITEGLDVDRMIEEINADVIETLLQRMGQLEAIGLSHVIGVEETEDGYEITMTDSTCVDNPKVIEIHHGGTFVPTIDEDFNLSWSNDKDFDNPQTVNIKGATFTPHVSLEGDLSWLNDKDLTNPETVNIKGERGYIGAVYEKVKLTDRSVSLDPMKQYRIKPFVYEGGHSHANNLFSDSNLTVAFDGNITSDMASVADGSTIYLIGEQGLYVVNGSVVTKKYDLDEVYINNNLYDNYHFNFNGNPRAAVKVGDYIYLFTDVGGNASDDVTLKFNLNATTPALAESCFEVNRSAMRSGVASIGSKIYLVGEGTEPLTNTKQYELCCIDAEAKMKSVIKYFKPYATGAINNSLIILPVGTKLYMLYNATNHPAYYENSNESTPVYVYDTLTGKIEYLYVDFQMQFAGAPLQNNVAVMGTDIYIYHPDGTKIFDTITKKVRKSKGKTHIGNLLDGGSIESVNTINVISSFGEQRARILYGNYFCEDSPYEVQCQVALDFDGTKYPIQLFPYDEYHRDYFTFEILSMYLNDEGTILTVAYEFNGERYLTTIQGENFKMDSCKLVITDTSVTGSLEVLKQNLTSADITPSGGGSSVELDSTLTEEGKAADAKAVGDKLEGKLDKPTLKSGFMGTTFVKADGTNVNVYTDDYSCTHSNIARYVVKTMAGDKAPSGKSVLITSDPEKPYHCANKEYVDEKFNGANKAVSFVNYSSMITSLNGLENTAYSVGQNIMVVTLEVPDLWVSEVAEESVAYTYVSDTDFVNELTTNGFVQVGYYKLSALETQKVDLTEYAKTEQLDGKVDKVTTTGANRVYIVNSNGNNATQNVQYNTDTQAQAGWIVTYGASGSGKTISQYNPGYLVTSEPENDYQAANKKYVDKGMWLPAYDETATYSKDVMVISDGKIYKSLIDDNTGNALTDTASWEDLLSGKLDTKTTTDNYRYAYYYDKDGQRSVRILVGSSNLPTNSGAFTIPAYLSNTAMPNAVLNDDRVVLATGTPKYPVHAANKNYVDTATKLYKRTIELCLDGPECEYCKFTTYSKTDETIDFATATMSDIVNHLNKYYTDIVGMEYNTSTGSQGSISVSNFTNENDERLIFTVINLLFTAEAMYIATSIERIIEIQ